MPVLQLYWNHTSAWVFSFKFAAYLQNTFSLRTPLDGCFPANISTLFQPLSFGWYDVTTWDSLKSMLKQRCAFQRWNLQRRINVVHFNVDMNSVRKRWNNVDIFKVEFHNVRQRQNTVVKMPIFKKNQKKNNFKFNALNSKF